MKISLRAVAILLSIVFCKSATAQLSGVYTVPGSFSTIAAAINSLNIGGISGAVTINIAAGYTETATPGGFQVNTITNASIIGQVSFKKNGTGPNPVVFSYTGGVGVPGSGSVQDGIWRFVGTDWVTIDGIDLYDQNTTNPSTMEYGYGFFKTTSGSNGCQYNTIRNCTITLNRVNAAAGSGSSTGGSKGIYVSPAHTSFYTQAVNTQSFVGSNSYNKFYSNYIQNCQTCISLSGYDNQGYTLHCDQFNDIGGLSAATGNTLVNFGGAPGNTNCYGIECTFQYSLNASFNTINNNNGSGLDPANEVGAIRTRYFSMADVTINSNTISLSAGISNTSCITGIMNVTTNTLNFGTPAIININNNVFASVSTGSTTSAFIYQQGLISTISFPSITYINGNNLQNINCSYLPALISCYRASTCTINSNTVNNVVTTGGSLELIRSDAQTFTIGANTISNFTAATIGTGNIDCITGGIYSSNMSVLNNTITNINANQNYGVYMNGNLSNSNYTVNGNQISQLQSIAGATTGIGIYGLIISHSTGNSNATISGNTVNSFSCLAAFSSSNSGASMTGIYTYSTNPTIAGNKVYGFISDRQNTNLYGINCNGTSSGYSFGQVHNNIIGDLVGTNIGNNISGIFMSAHQNNVSFNTIYLSGATTGSNTNSAALTVYSPVSNYTTSIRNNILTNYLPVAGTGSAMAMNIYSITMYGSSSNRNILDIGTPGTNRFIARVGNNTYATITAFKTAVSPRETLTFTETPVFAATAGSNANFLNLNPTVTTLAENGGVPISGITVDYAGTIRNVNNPDIGAWEGNYAGFDRVAPVPDSSGFLTLPCGNFTTRTFTITLRDTSGIAGGSFSPRLYYRVNSGSWTSVQGILISGTPLNGVWSFTLNYTATANSTISYYIAVQDQSSFNNLGFIPNNGGVGTNVNSVQTPPSPFSYVLQNYPTISATSGSICSGQSFTINAYGASTFTYSSGTNIVAPAVTTVYSITGTSSSGCAGTNTATAIVNVVPTPTLSVNSDTVCFGAPFTFSPTGATSYTIQGGQTLIFPFVSKTYTIVGKTGACYSAIVISTVTVLQLPTIAVSGGPQIICAGESTTLNANGAIGFTWQPEGGNSGYAVLSPTQTTMYTVTGEDLNGCKNVANITILVDACLSIGENNSAKQVKIYPVPGNEILNVEIAEVENCTLRIYNSSGQLMFEDVVTRGQGSFDLSSLSEGLYLINICKEQKIIHSEKIIRN